MVAVSVLIPFPSGTTEWSIAQGVVDRNDVDALVQGLAPFGVEHYPAGEGRAVVALARHGNGEWRAHVERFCKGALSIVAHDDFDASWRLPADPVWLTPNVRVVSTAAGASPAPDLLVLNPGLAFGDCRHPTTRLCAQAIDDLARGAVARGAPTASLLDVGCGSGILALVAARAGVVTIGVTDIDPYCRHIAERNAERNGIGLVTYDALPQERFAMVVANIWATAFAGIAEALDATVAEGGALILSGFAVEDGDHVAGLFPRRRFARVEQDGWVALTSVT